MVTRSSSTSFSDGGLIAMRAKISIEINMQPRNKNKLGTLLSTSSSSKYLPNKSFVSCDRFATNKAYLSTSPGTDTGATLLGLTYAVSKGFQMTDP